MYSRISGATRTVSTSARQSRASSAESTGSRMPSALFRIESRLVQREHLQLGAERRIAHDDLEQEAIELRLGKRECSFVLDRILRREHGEQRAERCGFPSAVTCRSDIASSSADWVFAGARLISSASKQIGEHRAGLKLETARRIAIERDACHVGRHEIRRELDARETHAHRRRERAHEQRLRRAGHAFDQRVPAREKRDQNILDRRVLPDDSRRDGVAHPTHRLRTFLYRYAHALAGGGGAATTRSISSIASATTRELARRNLLAQSALQCRRLERH